MRSRATSARACSGSKRRTRTERSPAAPGTRTPLSSPEMWAMGAGMSTASRRAEAVDAGHERRLPTEASLRVEHRLGDAGRARGEQDQRHVGGAAGRGPGGHRGAPDGFGERGGSEIRPGRELDDERRVDLPEGRLDVCRAEGVQDGRRDGADAPAGPGQDGGGQAVGDLPGHGVAAAHAPFPQPAGDRRHQGVRLGGREPGRAVDHLPAVRGEQGVQRRHVPGAARPAVAAGQVGYPGRLKAGRHGRAPYPGPDMVTPMSGWSREPAWTSR